jgi:hypothetical protein
VPEETLRALEGHRARRLAAVFGATKLDLGGLVELGRELRRLGAGVRIRAPDPYVVFELLPQRPLAREERERLWWLAREACSAALWRAETYRSERRLLERAGLGALAWMVPELLWDNHSQRGGGWRAASESSRIAVTGELSPPVERLLPEVKMGEGRSYVLSPLPSSTYIFISLPEVGDRELGLLEELVEADRAIRRWMEGWEGGARKIQEAERRAKARLGAGSPSGEPLSEYVRSVLESPLHGTVWEEDGKVKVWLRPEVREQLLWALGLAPGDYLRAVSEELGKEIELVEGEAPLPPELAAAVERARRALAELVGSGSS